MVYDDLQITFYTHTTAGSFTSPQGHHYVIATVKDDCDECIDGIKKVYASYTATSGDNSIRAIDIRSLGASSGNSMGGSWTWLAVKHLQLEKSNSPTTFYDQLDHTGYFGTYGTPDNPLTPNIQHNTGLYQLLLHGKILNSPLAFCDGDNFLIDSARGYGSAEYGPDFKVIGGTYGNPHEGHPSYPVSCNGNEDCTMYDIDGVHTFICEADDDDDLTPRYCTGIPSGYYYPTTQIYDGWSVESEYPTITPSNLGEQAIPKLKLSIVRDFHGIYTSTSTHHLPDITINVIGINPPHIHFLNYDSESKPQIGVQSSNILQDQPTLQYYNNSGIDIMSEGEGSYSDSNTYTYDTTDDDFGVKSIGSINFTSYEGIVGQQPRATLTVDGEPITNIFNAYTSQDNITGEFIYIWTR